MTSRDLVLGRLRTALGGHPGHPAEPPRAYRGADHTADVDLLVGRLTDYRAVVHRCPDGRVATTVDAILAGRRFVVPPGLPEGWLPATADVLVDDGLTNDLLSQVEAVLTGATVAVAETGTIVLDGSPGQGRRVLTLLPDLHVCVLRAEQVVANVPAALTLLDPRRPLTWVSGPSATSDIELNRVEGVHGPRHLHVVLVD